MKKYFRLYLKFLAQYLKSLMEYKTDFLIGLFSFVLAQSTGITFIVLLFNYIPDLNGWKFYEIMFIYGFAQIPRGLDHLLTDNLWLLSGTIIVKGNFDRYLLRPINPLFHLLAEKFQPDAFGELLVGVALITVSVMNLNIKFGIVELVLLIILSVFSSLIYTSVKLFFASFAFWVKDSQTIVYTNYTIADFAKYPIEIYIGWLQKILTFIIPFAFTAYYPAVYFIRRSNMGVSVFATIGVSVFSFFIAYKMWEFGISKYEGSGS